ncbi:MAG TPA: hypothetical protein VJC13_01635 [Candidatus Paceibacterota bacterium]
MGIEERYINHLDAGSGGDMGLEGQGFPAEEVVVNFFNASGFDARFSTATEDEGTTDIGPKQIIDAVVYYDGKPAMAPQITTSTIKSFREKKLDELRQRPFLRLDEMGPSDPAIPKVLIYLKAKDVKAFGEDPDFSRHPEIALQILNSSIISLNFDLSKTENPLEQKAITELVGMLETEKKKYIH